MILGPSLVLLFSVMTPINSVLFRKKKNPVHCKKLTHKIVGLKMFLNSTTLIKFVELSWSHLRFEAVT